MKNWQVYMLAAPLWISAGFFSLIAGTLSKGAAGTVMCGLATLFCWMIAGVLIVSLLFEKEHNKDGKQ